MKKLLCLALCFVLAVSVLITALCAPATSELEDEIDRIDQQIAANKEKLEQLENDREKQKEYLDALEAQIDSISSKATSIQTQINTIDNEIFELDAEINQISNEMKQTEKDIVATENKISDTSDTLASKLRSAYINGNDSTLKILMGADSLASFLTRLEFMKRTSERDKEIILGFREDIVNLNEAKIQLEINKVAFDEKKATQQQKKAELEAKQDEYEKTMDSLEVQYAEIDEYIEKLDKSSTVYEEYISELEKDRAAADAEIDRIMSEYYATSVATTLPASNNDPTAPQGGYVSGESWAWPLGSEYCYISSGYGNRDASISGWSFHGGIDIAGGSGRLHGKPVYATRSGKVITAITSDSGYGIYVILDHGDGYSSLYAHMSARYVSTGDYVTKGQMIGRVGNTGNSQGAHLHFEVRYYGEKKDPLNYVSKQ